MGVNAHANTRATPGAASVRDVYAARDAGRSWAN